MLTLTSSTADLILRASNALALSAVSLVGLWIVWRIAVIALEVYHTPLRNLPGPPPTTFALGNVMEFTTDDIQQIFLDWGQKYGRVFAIYGLMGTRRGIATDHKAVGHIYKNNMIYYKPDAARFQLGYLLGDGVVTAEGLEHRHQRRGLLPAFNTNQLRELFPVFIQKSAELRDLFQAQIQPSTSSAQVDVLHWFYRAAIDILGLAGFNYDFNTLQQGETGNELAAAIHRVNSPKKFPLFLFFRGLLPFLRRFEFDQHSKEVKNTRLLMRDIGLQMFADKERGFLEKGALAAFANMVILDQDKDILSQIIRLNMNRSAEEKLSVDQVVDQIPTFLVAGYETLGVALAWCLMSLSQNKHMQTRLREELLQAFPDDMVPITMESLEALPYLDAVVRETLRYDPPVDVSARVAMQDDIIPLEKPIVLKDGRTVDHLEVKKGDQWLIPLYGMNRSKDVWGEDGDQFNPDRWLRGVPAAAETSPGAWSHIMTFLAGSRSCIGYRFALLEMKSILLHLIRAFEFELDADPNDIIHKALIVTRPMVRSNLEKGSHMPMIIKPVVA
ncbi:cytochrome P450 [Serendipita vermifera]|nr:cytochrome P450 [Serendipita vermifera]